MLKDVDWEHWVAFFSFIGIVGGGVWFIVKRFIPTREEYESLKETILLSTGKIAEKVNRHESDVRSLFRERASFRNEVLSRINHIEERIDMIFNDVSDLKDILIGKK